MSLIAIPYTHNDPDRLQIILDHCVQHRPWFDDFVWPSEESRRLAVIKYIADALTLGAVLEVYSGANLVGLLILNEVKYRTDAKCHFIFFDRKLSDKVSLCKNTMDWAFQKLGVHRLSAEIPTYASALASFAYKYLGFRYEAENRPWTGKTRPKHPEPLGKDAAALGSRKHQAILYEGEWHDVLLLSITREEFYGTDEQRSSDVSRESDKTASHQ